MKPAIFLFNHDAAHQVAHSAGLAGALALHSSNQPVVIAYASEQIRTEVEKLLSPVQVARITWFDLRLPGWLYKTLSPLNRFLPARRIARLYWHRQALRRASIIISTERTCLTLKRHWRGKNCPVFAYIPHGSGDRSVAVHPALKDFDLCLLSGEKVVDQLVSSGTVKRENCRIIGYPKFDSLRGRQPEQFFANDRPTFLYNPHFDPHLSSWYDNGPAILQWFYERPEQYNLIFAPHVMLFSKELHISPEYKLSRRRPGLDEKYRSAPNMRIDIDSERLFDMSYTMSAHAYIGDVSSQIYEFLVNPRPCYFIDTHSGDHSEPYDSWRCGPVVRSASALFPLLDDWQKIGEQYSNVQEKLILRTFDHSETHTAGERGAEAVANYLAGTHQWASQSD